MLTPEANEDDHLALLGLLNSSTACFWMKQNFQTKGSSGIRAGHLRRAVGIVLRIYRYPVCRVSRYQKRSLYRLPVCWIGSDRNTSPRFLYDRTRRRHQLQTILERARATATSLRGQMIALQEELDWQCYHLYGLLTDDLRYDWRRPPRTRRGPAGLRDRHGPPMSQGRTCNLVVRAARFDAHHGTSGHWPGAYRKLVERRIEIIETNKEIGLIERPEYKRRWNDEPWQDQQQRALRNWLLDRLETSRYRKGTNEHPEFTTTARLADKASGDHDFLQVAALYRGRPDFDVAALVNELVESESVPFLPVLRYKPSGLRKREVWERTWDLQRKQDAGEDVGDIPVPPKYTSADFLKQDYWRLRGKLDVPKERWISYPHLQTDSDPSLVVGWAGWDHLQQATALVAYYDARKRDGWDAKRLTPILAGLDQLLPWIHQWHPEIDPEFGDTAGQSYQSMLEHDAHELGLTLEDIRNWEPPKSQEGHEDDETHPRSEEVVSHDKAKPRSHGLCHRRSQRCWEDDICRRVPAGLCGLPPVPQCRPDRLRVVPLRSRNTEPDGLDGCCWNGSRNSLKPGRTSGSRPRSPVAPTPDC